MGPFSDEGKADLLRMALEAQVPLLIEEYKHLSWPELQEIAHEASGIIAHKGDIILFRSSKKGETAAAFNALARGIAALSFAPGGVKIFGLHFESKLEGPSMGAADPVFIQKAIKPFLQTAVPLWVVRFQELSWEDLKEVMKDAEKVIEESGELATFAQFKPDATAKAFNSIARAIAALSFVPRGIDIFGMHFETKYQGPSMGASATDFPELSPDRSVLKNLVFNFGDEKGHALYRALLERLGGVEPVGVLGYGLAGVAYRMPGGRALKLNVTDPHETQVAELVRKIPHPNIARVHDVFVLASGGKEIGVILRDAPLMVLQNEEPDLSNLIMGALQRAVKRYWDMIEKRTPRAGRLAMNAFAKDLRALGHPLASDIAKAVWAFRDMGVTGFDLHGENVGIDFDEEDRPIAVVFDWGVINWDYQTQVLPTIEV